MTIVIDTEAGKHIEITLEKTGDETGLLTVQSWTSNQDHRREDPSRDDTLKIHDIHFDQTRRLVCKGDMLGSTPSITCTLTPAAQDQKPFVRVLLAETFASLADGQKDYFMGKSEFDELKQFLIESKFPLPIPSVIKNEKRGADNVGGWGKA